MFTHFTNKKQNKFILVEVIPNSKPKLIENYNVLGYANELKSAENIIDKHDKGYVDYVNSKLSVPNDKYSLWTLCDSLGLDYNNTIIYSHEDN